MVKKASDATAEANGTAKKAGSWSDSPGRAAKNEEHLKAMEEKPAKGAGQVFVIPKLDIRILEVTLVGDESLIVHHWSAKAIKEMLDKQMGVPNEGKAPKDPEQDYRDSLYVMEDGSYGFPAIAFKNAAVTACTSLGKSITKVMARQAFHVIGELVRIDGPGPSPREDMVRVGQGSADIRYRAEFKAWSVTLQLRYNHRVLTAAQILNLFNAAGFAVGVGEWRSEKDGSHGLFHVQTIKEL